MLNYSFDISGLASRLKISKRDAAKINKNAVIAASWAAYNQIQVEADKALRRTRQEYKRSLGRPVIKGYVGTITLANMLPNMIEQGASPFDIKRGFAMSDKRKMSKSDPKTWYMHIPFRLATSGAIADSAAFSGKMPASVENWLKGGKAKVTAPFFGVIQKGVATPNKVGFGMINVRPAIPEGAGGDLDEEQRGAYEHATREFAGVSRQKKFYEVRTSGSYVKFRTVSEKSPRNSWIHKGLKARDLMPKGLDNADLDEVVRRSIDRSMDELGL